MMRACSVLISTRRVRSQSRMISASGSTSRRFQPMTCFTSVDFGAGADAASVA